MKCFMFTSVGLAILFSLTLCLSSQAMPQDDNATKEVAEEEQAGDPIMKLHRLGLRGSAVRELLGRELLGRELLGQLEEAEGSQFHKLLANQDEVNTWSFGISPSVSSLDLAELFMNELKQADEATATGSKLAELEQQVNELTKAVQKLQESTNGCLLYTSPSPRD